MRFGWVYIILGAIMWGIDGVFLTPKYFTYGLYNVTLIVFLAHIVPLLMLSITKYNNYKKLLYFKFNDILYLVLISIFGGAIGTLSIVKALQLSEFNPYSLVILIQKSQPIFAIIFAYIILKEKPNKRFYSVFFIVLISLYILTFGFNNPFLLEKKYYLASIYSLIAAISFGMSTTFSKKASLSVESNEITFFRFFFTSIISLLILLYTPIKSFNDFKFAINSNNIIVLVITISIWGFISTTLYYKGIKTTKAIYSTICELAFPITSVVLDVIINNNILDLQKLTAAVILILSIIYLNINKE